jgi:hypothetical protein
MGNGERCVTAPCRCRILAAPCAREQPIRDHSSMRLALMGVRGSSHTPDPDFVRYGGTRRLSPCSPWMRSALPWCSTRAPVRVVWIACWAEAHIKAQLRYRICVGTTCTACHWRIQGMVATPVVGGVESNAKKTSAGVW